MQVSSDLRGTFKLNQGVLSFSFLHFLIPGTHADMTGKYSLDGNTFDFHGVAEAGRQALTDDDGMEVDFAEAGRSVL